MSSSEFVKRFMAAEQNKLVEKYKRALNSGEPITVYNVVSELTDLVMFKAASISHKLEAKKTIDPHRVVLEILRGIAEAQMLSVAARILRRFGNHELIDFDAYGRRVMEEAEEFVNRLHDAAARMAEMLPPEGGKLSGLPMWRRSRPPA